MTNTSNDVARNIQAHLDRYEKEHGPQSWDRALNFGAGLSPMKSNDRTEWWNVDIGRIPHLPQDFLDLVVAWHVFEHITPAEYLRTMEWLWTRMKPDGLLVVEVPHGANDMAWENPTHVRAYFPQSFGFLGQPFYWRENYRYIGDFRVERVEINIPSKYMTDSVEDLHESVTHFRNIATVMRGYLRAVKPGRSPNRELQEGIEVVYVEEHEGFD